VDTLTPFLGEIKVESVYSLAPTMLNAVLDNRTSHPEIASRQQIVGFKII
jgi:hypothetical protein